MLYPKIILFQTSNKMLPISKVENKNIDIFVNNISKIFLGMELFAYACKL